MEPGKDTELPGGKAIAGQLDPGVIDKTTVNSALNSISDHLKEILGGGAKADERSPLPTRKPSGAAILLKMILNELETQSPSLAPNNPFARSSKVPGNPEPQRGLGRVSSFQLKKTPPPLPPNKPRSRSVGLLPPTDGNRKPGDPRLANLFGRAHRLVQVASASGTSSPRSCLKKTTSEYSGENPSPKVTLKPVVDCNNNISEDTTSGLQKNSVRFSDETRLPGNAAGTTTRKDVGGDAVVPEVYDETDLATETVTTLSNVISSGYDYLNEVFQPIAYLKRFVSTDLITLNQNQTKGPQQ